MAQTVGNWIAKYRKQHGVEQKRKSKSDAQELARMKAELHKARMENEFLTKKRRPSSRRNSRDRQV
ncbi:hypothetical protein [Actinomyces sp. Z5]|uniref:hypothetical protein n=1 Tax=Actinomyces sp. Z5 TaxID=2250216 RepID=UPI0011BD6C2E|nr:hypothetical protein [Actinomyces sp. Z5]